MQSLSIFDYLLKANPYWITSINNSMKLKNIFIFFLTFLVLSFFVSVTYAAVGINKQINFQGKLTNADGTNVADNTYSVVFTLYDA